MYCPKCRCEYREGFTVCSDCGVALVEELGPEPEPEYTELVTVYVAKDDSDLAVAESRLDGTGIRFLAKGEGVQDLFAAGTIGGFNPMVGPVEIQVLPEDADFVRDLLALPEDAGTEDEPTASPPE